MEATYLSPLNLAKISGIVSSGFFAGFCWSHSFSTASTSLLANDDTTMIKQWTLYYMQGSFVAIPCTLINISSWAFLAYSTKQPLTRQLFVTAAITTGSATVFAWTILRQINGALAIKSEKIIGPYTGSFTAPMTYSRKERASQQVEKQFSVRELVEKWKTYNYWRSGILIAGTIIGAFALAMES